jgi:hypothetical protein
MMDYGDPAWAQGQNTILLVVMRWGNLWRWPNLRH